jgi:hypothetical protein
MNYADLSMIWTVHNVTKIRWIKKINKSTKFSSIKWLWSIRTETRQVHKQRSINGNPYHNDAVTQYSEGALPSCVITSVPSIGFVFPGIFFPNERCLMRCDVLKLVEENGWTSWTAKLETSYIYKTVTLVCIWKWAIYEQTSHSIPVFNRIF